MQAILVVSHACFLATARKSSYEIHAAYGATVGDTSTPAKISVQTIENAGGEGNNGFLARVESAAPHFAALPPLGGTPCEIRTNTSATAAANKPVCRLATNGGPFSMASGACQGVLYHNSVPLLTNWNATITSEGIHTAMFALTNESTWVIGNLDTGLAASLHIREALSGFGWLVRNGKAVKCTDSRRWCTEVAPRTAIGIDKDGRLLMLVVDGCEHCSQGEQGLSVRGTADLLVTLGAHHAINLDGGGSSVFYHNGSVADRPTCKDALTPVCERAVATVACVT